MYNAWKRFSAASVASCVCVSCAATAVPPPPAAAPPVSASPPVPPPPAPAAPPVDPAEPLGSTISNAVTTSSGSVADADRVILALRPKLRRCYEAARGAGPQIEGMVTCGVRITKAGTVGAVGVTRRNSLPNALVECIVRELHTAVFEPREADAVIQVPVRFGMD
jgi:hypothetical protein